MIEKNRRWVEKDYTRWVATLPCAGCGVHDETIVPHHMKHICQELTGGMSMKASDWLAMPLCFSCHDKVHNADRWLIEYQPIMILKTLDKAYNSGIMVYEPKLVASKEEQRLWRESNLTGEELYD